MDENGFGNIHRIISKERYGLCNVVLAYISGFLTDLVDRVISLLLQYITMILFKDKDKTLLEYEKFNGKSELRRLDINIYNKDLIVVLKVLDSQIYLDISNFLAIALKYDI